MAESKRLESSPASDAVDRDSQAEALLVDGLDRYFDGRYDEAIHLWTRVLFFDRSHARARAYIDRARTALAERQRRTDEVLHRTGELLDAGHTDQARAMLAQAAAAVGDDERVASLRWRLERLERARGAQTPRMQAAVVDAVPIGPRAGAGRRILSIAALVAGAVVAGIVARPFVENWLTPPSAAPPAASATVNVNMPVLTSAEAAMVRARTLYGRGRLAEALQALDRVDAGSPEWRAADQMRVQIQQILLASRRGLSSAGSNTERGRP